MAAAAQEDDRREKQREETLDDVRGVTVRFVCFGGWVAAAGAQQAGGRAEFDAANNSHAPTHSKTAH